MTVVTKLTGKSGTVYRIHKTDLHGVSYRIHNGSRYVGKTSDGGYSTLKAAIRYCLNDVYVK